MDIQEWVEVNNNIDYSENVKQYNCLCDRAKGLIVQDFIFDKCLSNYIGYGYMDNIEKLTPIEQVYMISYYIISQHYTIELKDFLAPSVVVMIELLQPQVKLNYENKKYIVDFMIDFSVKKYNSEEYLYPLYKDLKYVIELDGKEYHSNTRQINYDYEREINLTSMGYKVIRFTGSQVIKEPFTCVYKTLKIIYNDLERKNNE